MEHEVTMSFDPVEHKYTDERGRVYTSVTTLIGKYKPVFDKKYWSMYTALRDSGYKLRPSPETQIITVNGIPRTLESLYTNPVASNKVTEIVQKWEHLTNIACERGNEIHDYLEDTINESKGDVDATTNEVITPLSAFQGKLVILKTKHDLDTTNLQVTYPTIYTRLLMYINMGCTLYAEKRIYSTTYQIAGMIDVLAVKGKHFAIVDWKTNKDLMMFRSGYFKKKQVNGIYVKTEEFIDKKSYLHFPLNNIEQCKGMEYTCQLSLYAYLMELWGYILVDGGLEIFHIRPGLAPKLIKVRYLKNEIHNLLEHHKSGKKTKPSTNFKIK